ncbi:RebB family R body protein [Uliginosibacterium gangwonense]|uniref:RebB family R body protein n=1 Tax=Uliginosibacterium gangwonense TaxID=392736 RepID=UPI000379B2CD|nr:RebB family R body protein [Uliginosibacterium gangwonense]
MPPSNSESIPSLEAASLSDELQIALAPSAAMGMTDIAMANSLSLHMGNAVANQQRGQTISEAALSQVLVLILTKGASGK